MATFTANAVAADDSALPPQLARPTAGVYCGAAVPRDVARLERSTAAPLLLAQGSSHGARAGAVGCACT